MQIPLLSPLFQQATAQGSRSTVLRPLGWLLAILVTAVLSCVQVKAASWIIIAFAVASFVTIALYIIAFVYCLATDKDALRSETYSIQKLAIEKGFFGDSNVGMFEGSRAALQLGQVATGADNQ